MVLQKEKSRWSRKLEEGQGVQMFLSCNHFVLVALKVPSQVAYTSKYMPYQFLFGSHKTK
ncbi:hypothetical protein RchiOBHm_Chr5g0082651 [Rosa chinensis]|uniref:Uncharacterized protein n=1 Tax=Rosa chinensis TaxID=74649 RepID=A0A2P6QND4_ROSCH|nr:hypothetical protein RchiOBHm_Chr5g0082651 [Rosa chinensis]